MVIRQLVKLNVEEKMRKSVERHQQDQAVEERVQEEN